MTESELNTLIRDALASWKEPDPHVIARRLYGRLSDEQREQMVVTGLAARIGQLTRMELTDGGIAPSPPRVGRSKWQRNVRYTQRVCVAGEYKFLGDCTVADVEALAVEREERAARLSEWAARWRELAARMRATGAVTVSELPDVDTEGLAA
jgi:hypothetical protein